MSSSLPEFSSVCDANGGAADGLIGLDEFGESSGSVGLTGVAPLFDTEDRVRGIDLGRLGDDGVRLGLCRGAVERISTIEDDEQRRDGRDQNAYDYEDDGCHVTSSRMMIREGF